MTIVKAGYKTSEFWFTLVSFIFSGLYLTGIINDNQHKEELISTVTHAVESCILIGGQLIILYRYIKGRSEVKKIIEIENNKTQTKLIEENIDDTQTVNNRTSRKTSSRNKTKSTKRKKSSPK